MVTYTDGTTTRITQSLSDWFTPQNYPGESQALTMGYRVTASGATDNRTFHLYGYSFALNSANNPIRLFEGSADLFCVFAVGDFNFFFALT